MIKSWAHSEARCTCFSWSLEMRTYFFFRLGCYTSLFYEACPHFKILWAFSLRVVTTFPYQKPSGAFSSQVWLNAPRDVDLRVVYTGIRHELDVWGVRVIRLPYRWKKRPILLLFIFSENVCMCVTLLSSLWREVRLGSLLSTKDVDYKHLQTNKQEGL
jgi:hypothetical protein